MTLSVRLDEETKKLVARMARAQKTSRSEIVRRAIHAFANSGEQTEELSLYDKIKDIIGAGVPGLPKDGSTRVSEYFRQHLVEKKRKGRF